MQLDEVFHFQIFWKAIICLGKLFFCLAVTKDGEVEISMVKHFRIDLDEKYEMAEKWLLKDLEMIDGKEADTVSAVFYCKFLLTQCIYVTICDVTDEVQFY